MANRGESPPGLDCTRHVIAHLSGPEVLRSLKKNVLTAHIPVVVCSSLSQKNEAKLVREGACAFIEKGPLLENPDLLLETIRIALAKSGAKSMTPGSPHPEVEVQ
jgi:CheY-like chemotaxis protein